jgi:hypothetical protein
VITQLLPILLPLGWLVLTMLVLAACRVAARADDAGASGQDRAAVEELYAAQAAVLGVNCETSGGKEPRPEGPSPDVEGQPAVAVEESTPQRLLGRTAAVR